MPKYDMVLALVALVTTPTLLAAQSDRFREQFTLPVTQVDSNSFEVVEADGAGNTQMWCAAGVYVRKGLGLREGDITIEIPRGPSLTKPGRKGVVFSTAPVPGAFKSVWPGLRKAGRSYTVTHAFALCRGIDDLNVRTGPNTLLRN